GAGALVRKYAGALRRLPAARAVLLSDRLVSVLDARRRQPHALPVSDARLHDTGADAGGRRRVGGTQAALHRRLLVGAPPRRPGDALPAARLRADQRGRRHRAGHLPAQTRRDLLTGAACTALSAHSPGL